MATIPEALNFALQHYHAGRLPEAEAVYQKVLQAHPDHPGALYMLGIIAYQVGKHAMAVEYVTQVIALNPGVAEFHNNLAVVYLELAQIEAAHRHLNKALELQPGYAEAHYNLGNLLGKEEKFEEAVAQYRQATALKPEYVDAYNNLGVALWSQGKLDEAVASCRHVLALKPDFSMAHNTLAAMLKDQGKLVEAVASCRQALALKPDYADAHQQLSTLLAYLSDYRQVVLESDTALQLKPDSAEIWEQRLYAFSYHPNLSAEDIYGEFVRWGDRYPSPMLDFSSHNRTLGRRLRVGYVSPDFRRHTSRFFFWPLFANHDHAVVELYAYSNVRLEDDFTRQFKGQFDHWRNIRGRADGEAAQMIRQDGIDILVDCCNHMKDERLGVFAMKPAPIQVTWLGAAWTTGLNMVDYVLSDPYMAPQGTLTRETIIRLPHAFFAYRPPEKTAEIAAPPCLKNGYITFGYSGRTERLNHRTFRVWGEILRRIPRARLILDFAPFADLPTQEHYRRFLIQQGVDILRVVMRKSANIFEGLNDIDMLLDSFPHNGGTMLIDALWMGVPALTLASRPPVGRIGASMMMNLSLPEWVAESEADYITKACTLSAHPDALAELRFGMRRRMQNSPLMDGVGFARAVEAAYRDMWTRWCGSEA